MNNPESVARRIVMHHGSQWKLNRTIENGVEKVHVDDAKLMEIIATALNIGLAQQRKADNAQLKKDIVDECLLIIGDTLKEHLATYSPDNRFIYGDTFKLLRANLNEKIRTIKAK